MSNPNMDNHDPQHRSLLPFAIAAILMALIAVMWISLDKKRDSDLRELISLNAKKDAALIGADYRARVPAINRIVDRWIAGGGTPKDEFEADLKNYIDDLPGLQALEWVDSNFYVRWIVPLKGNEQAQDLNLAKEERRRIALELARDKRTPTMTSPIDLVQGGKGFLVYFPIFVKDRFDGFLLAVFKTEPWVNYMLRASENDEMFSPIVLIDGETVYGDHGDNIHQHDSWVGSSKINILDHEFIIEIYPTEKFFDVNRSFIPELLAFIGILLSGLIAYTVFLYQQSSRASSITRAANILLEREVEERKLTQRELDFQKSTLDEHAIVSIADIAGNITYVNDKFCNISGYSREELIGHNHRILKSGEHSTEFYENLWSTISSGKPWNGEIKNLKKDGGYYWVDATIVPFMNEKGKPFQYVAIRTDITDRVLAMEEAEEANRAKSDFLSSMSHELRTPLNAIIGFGQLLSTDTEHPLNDDQLESVGQIKKGGEQLLELINEVLDLAKIESGKLGVSIEDVMPFDVVDACLSTARELGRKNDILINDECLNYITPENPCIIKVDQNRLRQVLLNLLSNAVKYNNPGGEVTLKCEHRKNGFLRFSIIDNGLGIAESNKDNLFVPFSRLNAEDTTIEGTGIGLTITKRLVDLMDGNIGFSSSIGEGSTFWVEFPLSDGVPVVSDSDIEKAKTEASNSITSQSTVLYVEDNPANLKLLEKVFKRISSVNMISAHTAELGLIMAEQEMPDLILMDINLPGMDGIEALQQLKLSEKLRHIPVLAVSANAMPHDIEKAMKVGFEGYISKPFQVKEIIDVVVSKLG